MVNDHVLAVELNVFTMGKSCSKCTLLSTSKNRHSVLSFAFCSHCLPHFLLHSLVMNFEIQKKESQTLSYDEFCAIISNVEKLEMFGVCTSEGAQQILSN